MPRTVRRDGFGRCAGVDGCRGGWVVATRDGVTVVEAIATVIDSVIDSVRDSGHAVVAIDMPIGMPGAEPRRCEIEARRFLSPRGSTIFPTPARVCLDATDYVDACARSLAVRGVKISQQSWHILPKIAEVDRAIDPSLADRVVEAHPECSFVTMNGGASLVTKHSPTGIAQRLELVEREFGVSPRRHGPAAIDDVLDAYAVLWSAERFADGEHRSFPAHGLDFDARGLPMRIVC